ncbi:MAG: putative endoglucanase [Fibrobacterota bacterium]|jgi:endoglucanase
MYRKMSALAAIIAASASISFAATPLDLHGRLQTKGNRIIGDKTGDTVQLTGMSFFWSQWPEGGNFYNGKTVNWLVDDFNCSVVRAAIGVGDDGKMGGDSAGSFGQVDAVVKAATARGIYSIIDWHSHYAIKNKAAAKSFFEAVAKKYGANPGVIFELFNEPWANVYTWPEIKAYAEEIIPIIRKYSPNLILVGTRQWSRDVDEASLDPISDTNVAYVLHFYAGSHRDTLIQRGRTALANGAPLFVSEWGTTNEDGGTIDKAIYPEATNEWFAWMDSNKISSCNWSVQNKAEASAILKAGTTKLSNWDSTDLTESGKFVRELVRSRNTMFTFELPPVDSSLLPGRIEAEDFKTRGDLTTSGPGDEDNSSFLGNSKIGSWAEYQTVVPQRRNGVIALRIGSGEANAQVTVKVNGKVATVVKFTGTGGWGKWKTVVSDSFLVAKGAATIRLEWDGLFDLNWLELTGRQSTQADPPQIDTIHRSVRIEAENAVTLTSLTKESSGDEDGTGSVGYTTDSSWAQFRAVLPTGKQVVAVRVASGSEGATLKFTINGAVKANVKVAGTGGWQTWKTVVATDSFTLDMTDSATIRVDWEEGKGQSSLVNLNWMEFRGPDSIVAQPIPVRSRSARTGLRAALSGDAIAIDFGGSFTGTVQVLDLHGRILTQSAVAGSVTANLPVPAWKGVALVRVRDAAGVRTVSVLHP